MYNLEAGEAVLTKDNDVDIFIDGNEKFRALMEDLRNAEHFIHIQYYIIKNDVLFHQIKDILIEKAAQGVEVRVLFDAMGCRSVRHSYWKWLNEKGVQTAEFFPAILRRLQLRINYRNHRKIVVIDNKVAYVGGFNVGKEYIDLDEKFGLERYPPADPRQCGTGAPGAIYFRLELCGRRESVFASGAVPGDRSRYEGFLRYADHQQWTG